MLKFLSAPLTSTASTASLLGHGGDRLITWYFSKVIETNQGFVTETRNFQNYPLPILQMTSLFLSS